MKKSIGALEFRSISKGIEVSNEVVKKAFVEVSYLKSICPGKFFLIVNGDAGEVKEAKIGRASCRERVCQYV